MILGLTIFPDKLLSEVSDPVTNITSDHITLIDDMFDTMYNHNGIGLAAVQVGITQRILVIDVKEPIHFINPIIVNREGIETETKEGCLSFPNVYANVKRDSDITVRYQTSDNKTHERMFKGLESICIQHEMDHLNGIVFPDRLSKLKRNMLIKKYYKSK